MPVRAIITSGTTADCTEAKRLMEGITAENLLADKGYDSDEIVRQAEEANMQVVIPPKHEFRTVINDGKRGVEKKIRMVMRCQVIPVRKTFIKHFYKRVV